MFHICDQCHLMTLHLNLLLLLIILTLPFYYNNASVNGTRVAKQRSPLEIQYQIQFRELRDSWPCSVPRPRLVYLTETEEHRHLITPNSIWIPSAVQLHRCEPTFGLCIPHPTRTCQPNGTEPVSLLLKHMNVIDGDQNVVRLTFTNHTSCACAVHPAL